ncbi:MAG TPA: 16S rRNA (cytosine(1402)-N(4))-methyltransferase RsmH [Gemmatimonadales bacterium]|nr:16S rRNA (cytosine(1402)-N(4))-methyltransferase RsmH [Gemmatimonadales bacterium]
MNVAAGPVYHVPVLASVVADLAAGCRRAVDATVGGGGHAELLIEAGAQVLAFDRDPSAVAAASARLPQDRATVKLGSFADAATLNAIRRFEPDFILLDLGVSSRQLDDPRRGFSFRRGAPLDMRMSGAGAPTAADLLNQRSEAELARVLRENADERRARRLARVIVTRRQRRPFQTADDFVSAIRAALGPASGPSDFARLFQALRIEVNDELGQLARALPALRDALVGAGRLVAISYHSGEHRIIKAAFREWARDCICPPRQPVCTCRGRALGAIDPRRPVRAAAAEIAANPRARSATLRGFRMADAT